MIMAKQFLNVFLLLMRSLLAEKGEGFARFHSNELETEKGVCCKTKLSVLFTQAQGKDDKDATISKTTFSILPDKEASGLQNR